MLAPTEKMESLSRTMSIITSSRHRFGTDAIVLSNFSKPRSGQFCCDLGTGCGIIPFRWLSLNVAANITAIDIQADAVDMLTRSIALNSNNNSGIIHPYRADLRHIRDDFPAAGFDLVACNPPYQPVGAGMTNADEGECIARHEICCTVFDAANAASHLLKFGGRFAMCHRPERLCDCIDAMRRAGLEPKRLKMVCQRDGISPWLLLIEGKKGGKPGLIIEPCLILEKQDGTPTGQLLSHYGEYGLNSTD